MSELALLFTGQGAQSVGMGREWHDGHAVVRERFDQASAILGYSLEEMCLRGDPAELTRTRHAQSALLVLGYAMHEAYRAEHPLPAGFMAGHSLGEITALAAAGALDFEDAVRLVKVRGEAMDRCASSSDTGMVAVLELPVGEVERMVEEYNEGGHGIEVSNYNAARQTVVSGLISELPGIEALAEARGGRAARLNVAGAFHSTHMAAATAEYVDALASVDIATPDVPVCSTVTGRIYRDAASIREALAVQLTRPVRWSEAVATLAAQDVSLWVEIGPKRVLARMVEEITGSPRVHLLSEASPDVAAAVDTLEQEQSGPGVVGLCLGAAAATRNRNFDDADYDRGVIEPHKRLRELFRELDDAGEQASLDQARLALSLLGTIMATKRVPESEQQERIATIRRRCRLDADVQVVGGPT